MNLYYSKHCEGRQNKTREKKRQGFALQKFISWKYTDYCPKGLFTYSVGVY